MQIYNYSLVERNVYIYNKNYAENDKAAIKDNKAFYMVMKYAQNGDLSQYIRENGPLAEGLAKKLFHQLCLAVDHLHRHGWAHRDIKANNMLLDEDCNLLLGDFGVARNFMNAPKAFN